MDVVPLIMARIFEGFTLIKIGVAVGMVLGLSVLAEKVSTRFAGVVSGFPLGAAIVLFFIGYEIGPDFAAQSAVYSVFGLIGTLAFVFGYYIATVALKGRAGPAAAVGCVLIGLGFYFAAAALLRCLGVGLWGAVLSTSGVIVAATVVFRRLQNVRIAKPLRLSPGLLFLRAFFAAGVIILITASARLVGPGWAGLLSTFPMTMLPFLFIIHATYRADHVRSIIKNVPRGLGAIVVYGVVVALAYPHHGIWLGTLEGYLAATLYLVALLVPAYRRP
jgi:uncharacterized membrane protein (GlpM family)